MNTYNTPNGNQYDNASGRHGWSISILWKSYKFFWINDATHKHGTKKTKVSNCFKILIELLLWFMYWNWHYLTAAITIFYFYVSLQSHSKLFKSICLDLPPNHFIESTCSFFFFWFCSLKLVSLNHAHRLHTIE